MTKASSVVVGDPVGEHIRVSVLRRTHIGSGEYYDDNWLEARVAIRVAGFRADYAANLLTGDLAALRDGLSRLSGSRSSGRRPGHEEWEPIEPWLILRFDMDPDDGSVTGVANERLVDGNSLHFSMRVAWRTIDAAVDELDLLLIEFPLLGSPGSA